MARRLVRWKAVVPLALVVALVALLAWLFAEPVARDTAEEAASKALGTQVDLARVRLYPQRSGFALEGLQVADPFDSTRNLLQADRIDVKVDPVALAEKKLVVERLRLEGIRLGERRARPARPVAGEGYAKTLVRQLDDFRRRLDVPLVKLTPLDTLRQLALDPGQLGTVKAAKALLAAADSSRQAVTRRVDSLRFGPLLDSARALADSVGRLDPKQLDVATAARLVQRVQGQVKAVDQARARLAALEKEVRGGVQALQAGVGRLDAARQQDYAFARGLLKLPSLAAPDLSRAMFGPVTIDRFQQVLYWAELAQEKLPPGLQPRREEGPSRLRMAGTTVAFPKERHYPQFLLESGQVDLTVGGSSPLAGAYRAAAQGITTEPALVGVPMAFQARRDAPGTAVAALEVRGVLDHLGAVMRDSVLVTARGVALPAFRLPGLPLTLDPRQGGAQLAFALAGDQLRGRLVISAPAVGWSPDTAGATLNDLERLVVRTIARIPSLDLTAELGGTRTAPTLAIRTNLDEAVAASLRATIGEQVAKAEARVRAEVDRLVGEQQAAARQRVAAVQGDVEARLGLERGQLDQVSARLDQELKRLAGPAGGLIRIPKLKL